MKKLLTCTGIEMKTNADLMIACRAAPGGPGTLKNAKTNYSCHVPAVAAAGATFH